MTITVDTLHQLTVTTTAKEPFTGHDSARLAALLYRRFGRDIITTTDAWRQLLGNQTPKLDMRELVRIGLALEQLDELERCPNNLAHPLAMLTELVEKQEV